ncbi:hypothetical protein [Microcoleus sp. herbarium5]|uniref:hypothetical protein n=1 Tax=Microcoleus sp. herbarium5 TaxID=3055434 RepID=UPI002FD30163
MVKNCGRLYLSLLFAPSIRESRSTASSRENWSKKVRYYYGYKINRFVLIYTVKGNPVDYFTITGIDDLGGAIVETAFPIQLAFLEERG